MEGQVSDEVLKNCVAWCVVWIGSLRSQPATWRHARPARASYMSFRWTNCSYFQTAHTHTKHAQFPWVIFGFALLFLFSCAHFSKTTPLTAFVFRGYTPRRSYRGLHPAYVFIIHSSPQPHFQSNV